MFGKRRYSHCATVSVCVGVCKQHSRRSHKRSWVYMLPLPIRARMDVTGEGVSLHPCMRLGGTDQWVSLHCDLAAIGLYIGAAVCVPSSMSFSMLLFVHLPLCMPVSGHF